MGFRQIEKRFANDSKQLAHSYLARVFCSVERSFVHKKKNVVHTSQTEKKKKCVRNPNANFFFFASTFFDVNVCIYGSAATALPLLNHFGFLSIWRFWTTFIFISVSFTPRREAKGIRASEWQRKKTKEKNAEKTARNREFRRVWVDECFHYIRSRYAHK